MIQKNNTNQTTLPQGRAAIVDRDGNTTSPTGKVEHPKNGIVLMSGVLLECHPKEASQEGFTPDRLALDTTGVYFSIGNKRLKPEPKPSDEKKRQIELFIDNAFYLLSHRERIMRDSRMFLAPVAVQNGLAYTGTSGFNNPTIGIYLEWWTNCLGTMRTDNKGQHSLVYYLAGSPLSGCNQCSEVFENGKTNKVQLSSFSKYWRPFVCINTRYTEAKHIYEAYTLEEVLEILRHEDDGDLDYSTAIKELFMQHEIDRLNKCVEKLKREASEWQKKYDDTMVKYNEERISKAYAGLKALRARVETEIDLIREQKRELKAELKSGRLDNLTYQKKLTPLNKQIRDLEIKVSKCQYDLHNKFIGEGISYAMIESYMRDKEKDEND